MKPILDYNIDDITNLLISLKQPKFRAGQIAQWLFTGRVSSFEQMTNLSKELRQMLTSEYMVRSGEIINTVICRDGTKKFLIKWPDGVLTETVLMEYHDRNTVCISTQSGCPVRCAFCASGINGLTRSLTAGEIIEQVIIAAESLGEQRLNNVVIMGMGEPFANYANVSRAIKTMNADWGMNIGSRHITLSTIGIPDRIIQFAHDFPQITLAVSLHAPNDKLRAELIPWAVNFPMRDILTAIDDYYEITHREVTIEYVMLDGVNSLPKHAEALAKLLRPYRINVNLINYNTVSETGHKPAHENAVNNFMEILKDRGINVHLRQSKGTDINAACGQLRNSHNQ